MPKKKTKRVEKITLDEEDRENIYIWLGDIIGEEAATIYLNKWEAAEKRFNELLEQAPLEKKRQLLLARFNDPNDFVQKLIEIGFVEWKDSSTLSLSEKVLNLFKPEAPLTEAEKLERQKMLDDLSELDFNSPFKLNS